MFSVNYLGGAQPTYTFNFSRGSAMIQAQLYNFLRLGRSGYTSIVENMLANARFLNESLVASGRFEILNPGLAEPVVTFTLKGDPGFDVYHLSSRLREDGWIVPAYSLPPDAEEVHLMRVVVRLDLSRMMIEQLLATCLRAYDALEAEQPTHKPAPKPDVWTSPDAAAARARQGPAWPSDAAGRSPRGLPARICPTGWRVVRPPGRDRSCTYARAPRAPTAARSSGARGGTARGSACAGARPIAATSGWSAASERGEFVDRVVSSPSGPSASPSGSVPLYFDHVRRRSSPDVLHRLVFFTAAAHLQFHETRRRPTGPRPVRRGHGRCARSLAGAAPNRLGGRRPCS